MKFCVTTDHRKSIIFKSINKHFMSKPENDKHVCVLKKICSTVMIWFGHAFFLFGIIAKY